MTTAKRLLAILLCLALTLPLAACGQAREESGAEPQSAAPGTDLSDNASEPKQPEDTATLDANDLSSPTPTQSVPDDTLQLILNTYTARDFVAGEVAHADLELILRAGVAAPSARNSQPWHFIAVTDAALVDSLNFEEGMALIVVCGQTSAQEGVVVDFDCALATQNMFLAANALGLGAHIYTGPVRTLEEMRGELGIPDGYDPVALLAVGYESESVDAVTAASERNSLDSAVTWIS